MGLELLKEIAPNVTRAAILRDSENPAGGGQLGALQAVAPSLGVEVRPIGVRRAALERDIASFARDRNGGLIVPGSGSAVSNRKFIIQLAAQRHLPAVYPYRSAW
jgi:putative ABC transport system substrate-binding protein